MSEKKVTAIVNVEEEYRPGILMGVALSRRDVGDLMAHPNQVGGTTFESNSRSQTDLENLLVDCRFRIVKPKP